MSPEVAKPGLEGVIAGNTDICCVDHRNVHLFNGSYLNRAKWMEIVASADFCLGFLPRAK